jgi:hypothetical protein
VSSEAPWVFLPAAGAALAHAPVLTFDLFPALKRPMDFGARVRGRRVFGDNKTWRGALFMGSGVVGAAVALDRFAWFRARLPADLREAGPLRYGGLLAFGVVAGELPNSFLKRQLDVDPGERRWTPAGVAMVLFDQADFVIATWLVMLPVWRMPWRYAAKAFADVAGVHMVINVVGYALGARTSAI